MVQNLENHSNLQEYCCKITSKTKQLMNGTETQQQQPPATGTGRKPRNCRTATIDELYDDFRTGRPISGIEFICPHPSPHMDEIADTFVLQETPEGRAAFPGIEKAKIIFVTETQLRNDGYLGHRGFMLGVQNGYLFLGTGYGPFDEHDNRKEKISSFELVKRYLDLYATVEGRKIYGPLAEFINFEDNNGDNLIGNVNEVNPLRKEILDQRNNRFGDNLRKEADVLRKLNIGMVTQNLKKGFDANVDNLEGQEQVFRMGMQFLRNEVAHQRQFVAAEKEYALLKEKGEITRFELNGGFYGLVIQSSNIKIGQVARQKASSGNKNQNGMLGAIIIVRPTGQFVILPDKKTAHRMNGVYNGLFKKVLAKRPNDRNAVPELYIDQNMKIIMNGSKTDPDVPGLIGKALEIKDLVDAVKASC